MSDPNERMPAATDNLSLIQSMLLDQQYDSSPVEYIDCSSLLPEKPPSWNEWDVVGFLGMDAIPKSEVMEISETQSYSEVTGAKAEPGSCVLDLEQAPLRKKRRHCQTLCGGHSDAAAARQLTARTVTQSRPERQRGKNWEKAEEDVLVNCKRDEMEWKAISECLQQQGFTRNHKHCADKWYALRKHYLEIQQWILDNPDVDYWDRSNGERIRSVPPSFCQRWFDVFDAAEKKPEGRKKVQAHRPGDPDDAPLAAGFAARADSTCRAQLSSGPNEGLRSGDATAHSPSECLNDVVLVPNRAAVPSPYPNQANLNSVNFSSIGALVAEIFNLSRALALKFAAEEEERSRTLAIEEKKLDLKMKRFEYKRKRDEERQKSVSQSRSFPVEAYD